jgi:hypothetical protein
MGAGIVPAPLPPFGQTEGAIMAGITSYLTSLDPVDQSKLQGKQRISEIKWDTITFAAGAIPAQTSFFAAASPGDPALKNFDQNSQLVAGGKYFLIQWLAVNIITNSAAATFADVNAICSQCCAQIQIDQKIMGRFPIHALTGIGGVSAFSSQVAVTAAAAPAGAAGPTGVTNGMPQNQPFRVSPMLIEPLKAFSFVILGPTGTPVALTGTVTVRVSVGGLQFQAIQ